MSVPNRGGHILALSGGVGGAKLAAGLAGVLAPERLTVAVNTGDDFEHLGLTICPDIDSVVYALAGLNDEARGWGMAGESWQALAGLKALGEADWFALGDRDLAMHVARSHRLREGEKLSAVTSRFARALGIGAAVVPMSDAPVRTIIETGAGAMDFQRWFVAERCALPVRAVSFAGAGAAMAPDFAEALARDDLAGVVICPSNPFLSIDPILSLAGVREGLAGLAARGVPCLAVSPLIGGRAIKGPLEVLLAALGHPANNGFIADYYTGFLSHIIIDRGDDRDAAGLRARSLCVTLAPTLMRNAADREALAGAVLAALGQEPD